MANPNAYDTRQPLLLPRPEHRARDIVLGLIAGFIVGCWVAS